MECRLPRLLSIWSRQATKQRREVVGGCARCAQFLGRRRFSGGGLLHLSRPRDAGFALRAAASLWLQRARRHRSSRSCPPLPRGPNPIPRPCGPCRVVGSNPAVTYWAALQAFQGAAGACTARWCRVPARTFFARLFGGWSLSRRRGGPRTPWLHEEVWPAIKSHCGPDPASIAPEGSTAGMLPSAGVGAPRRHHAAVRLRASVRRNQMAVSALISACTRLPPRTPRRPVGRIPVCTATCSAGTAPVGSFGAEAS